MLLVMGWLFRCFEQHHQDWAGDNDWLRVCKSYMEMSKCWQVLREEATSEMS